jgi:hypothetical protein
MRRLLFLIGMLSSAMAFAQQHDTLDLLLPSRMRSEHALALLVGYHQGHYGFAELGIGRNNVQGGFCGPPFASGYYLGAEVRVDRPELLAVKAEAYMTGFFAMGLQYLHYMERPHADGPTTLTTMDVLRPEIGFGALQFKITYAYNWRLTKPHIEGVNTHMVSIGYAFNIARLPGNDPHRLHRAL